MIAPGCIVTCRQTGTILWVVVARADDGRRWRLRGKRVDWRGRSDVTCRVTGAGDLVLIRQAPTYSPGTMIEHTMRSRRSTHAFASLRSPSRKILGKGVFSDGTETEHACETDLTRGSLVAQNM